MVLMKTALQFSSHFSMAFYYVENIYCIKYSFTFFCLFCFMVTTAEVQIQELKSEEMWISWRQILNLWRCQGLYLALQFPLENLGLKTFKPFSRALIQEKILQDSTVYLQPRYRRKNHNIHNNRSLSTLCIIERYYCEILCQDLQTISEITGT